MQKVWFVVNDFIYYKIRLLYERVLFDKKLTCVHTV